MKDWIFHAIPDFSSTNSIGLLGEGNFLSSGIPDKQAVYLPHLETRHTLSFDYAFFNRGDFLEVLDFFNDKKGKLYPFWLPSWTSQLVMEADISLNGSVDYVDVKDANYRDYIDEFPVLRHVFLYSEEIGMYACRVDAVETYTNVEGETIERLRFPSDIGYGFRAYNTVIGFVLPVTFAIDRARFECFSAGHFNLKIGFIQDFSVSETLPFFECGLVFSQDDISADWEEDILDPVTLPELLAKLSELGIEIVFDDGLTNKLSQLGLEYIADDGASFLQLAQLGIEEVFDETNRYELKELGLEHVLEEDKAQTELSIELPFDAELQIMAQPAIEGVIDEGSKASATDSGTEAVFDNSLIARADEKSPEVIFGDKSYVGSFQEGLESVLSETISKVEESGAEVAYDEPSPAQFYQSGLEYVSSDSRTPIEGASPEVVFGQDQTLGVTPSLETMFSDNPASIDEVGVSAEYQQPQSSSVDESSIELPFVQKPRLSLDETGVSPIYEEELPVFLEASIEILGDYSGRSEVSSIKGEVVYDESTSSRIEAGFEYAYDEDISAKIEPSFEYVYDFGNRAYAEDFEISTIYEEKDRAKAVLAYSYLFGEEEKAKVIPAHEFVYSESNNLRITRPEVEALTEEALGLSLEGISQERAYSDSNRYDVDEFSSEAVYGEGAKPAVSDYSTELAFQTPLAPLVTERGMESIFEDPLTILSDEVGLEENLQDESGLGPRIGEVGVELITEAPSYPSLTDAQKKRVYLATGFGNWWNSLPTSNSYRSHYDYPLYAEELFKGKLLFEQTLVSTIDFSPYTDSVGGVFNATGYRTTESQIEQYSDDSELFSIIMLESENFTNGLCLSYDYYCQSSETTSDTGIQTGFTSVLKHINDPAPHPNPGVNGNFHLRHTSHDLYWKIVTFRGYTVRAKFNKPSNGYDVTIELVDAGNNVVDSNTYVGGDPAFRWGSNNTWVHVDLKTTHTDIHFKLGSYEVSLNNPTGIAYDDVQPITFWAHNDNYAGEKYQSWNNNFTFFTWAFRYFDTPRQMFTNLLVVNAAYDDSFAPRAHARLVSNTALDGVNTGWIKSNDLYPLTVQNVIKDGNDTETIEVSEPISGLEVSMEVEPLDDTEYDDVMALNVIVDNFTRPRTIDLQLVVRSKRGELFERITTINNFGESVMYKDEKRKAPYSVSEYNQEMEIGFRSFRKSGI